MSNEALQKPDSTTIPVDPLRRWTLYGLGVFLFAICLVAGAGAPALNRAGVIVVTLIAMSPALFFLFYVANRTRLVVSAQGIDSYNIGVSASVTWDEIQRISLPPGVVGIVLKKPSDQPGMRRLRGFAGLSVAGAPYYSDEQRRLISERRFIDLRAYQRQLHGDEFMGLLKTHAPEISRATRTHHDIEAAAFESQRLSSSQRGNPKRALFAVLAVVSIIVLSFLAGMDVFENTALANTPIWQWLATGIQFAVGVMVAILGVGSARTGWRQLTERSYSTGFMWLVFGIAQVLIAIAMITSID